MSLERINPDGLAPATGFSHAVRTSGTTVHLAGQTALNAEGRIIGDGIVEQFEQALSNLLAALEAAGGTPDRLASLTVYLVDVEAYKANARDIGRVWKRLVRLWYVRFGLHSVGLIRNRLRLVRVKLGFFRVGQR